MKKSVKNLLPLVALILALNGVNIKAAVNYDTAWTFVYDGGKYTDGTPIPDDLRCNIFI